MAARGNIPNLDRNIRDLAAVLRQALERLSEILSGRFAVDIGEAGRPDMLRLSVTEAGVRIFYVDFTRISGHVPETRVVVIDSPLGPQAVVAPTASYLFLMKLVHRPESSPWYLDCDVARASACSSELQFAVGPPGAAQPRRDCRLKPAAAR